jgi:hypothetical protein
VEQPVVEGEIHGSAALCFTRGLYWPDVAYKPVNGNPVEIDDAMHIVVPDDDALAPVDPEQVGDIPSLQHGTCDGRQVGEQQECQLSVAVKQTSPLGCSAVLHSVPAPDPGADSAPMGCFRRFG